MTIQGLSYLETLDNIQIVDFEGNIYNSFLFRFYHKSPNGLETEISAPSIIKATVAYQNVASAEQIAKRTEIIVNKQEQTITGIIENQGEYEEKLTQVEQTVDSISQNVGNIIDYKREVEGVTEIHLEDAGEADILELEIKGNKTYESNLYPGENVFPSDNLQPNMEVI